MQTGLENQWNLPTHATHVNQTVERPGSNFSIFLNTRRAFASQLPSGSSGLENSGSFSEISPCLAFSAYLATVGLPHTEKP